MMNFTAASTPATQHSSILDRICTTRSLSPAHVPRTSVHSVSIPLSCKIRVLLFSFFSLPKKTQCLPTIQLSCVFVLPWCYLSGLVMWYVVHWELIISHLFCNNGEIIHRTLTDISHCAARTYGLKERCLHSTYMHYIAKKLSISEVRMLVKNIPINMTHTSDQPSPFCH